MNDSPSMHWAYAIAIAILLGVVGPNLDEEIAVAQDKADAMRAAESERRLNESAKQACGTNAAWKLLSDGSIQCYTHTGRATRKVML
ncbi:MAG: hypothetical protein KGL39_35980 [Patescibacteria group bacterium]|nr:hypothetical protein [Patescibacteria group bacterium]